MRVRKFAALVAVPVVAVAALSACGSDDKGSDSTGKTGGIVTIGLAEPKSLVPTSANDTSGGQVVDALYAPLLKIAADGKATLDAAESIETKDSKVWTVKLKDGYTFHNGEKVTSQNYIDSWSFGAYGPNAQEANSFFEKIDGYTALNPTDKNAKPATKTLSGLKKVDDLTFEINLAKPFAEWKQVISYSAFYPMPASATASVEAAKKYGEAPIGQGPFKMKGTWTHDQMIEVEKYADYKGTKPKVDGVKFKIFQAPDAQYSELVGNTVDVMTAIPNANLKTAKTDLGDRFQMSPNASYTFIALPSYNDKFKDIKVRKAVSMAIDRAEIAKVIFNDTRKAADSFVVPIVPGYKAGSCGEACTFDPKKAKELLDSAGGFPGGQLAVTYNADGAGNKDFFEAVCNQVAKNLQIKCIASPEPKFADLRTKAKAQKDIGAFRMGWSMDYPSIENYLTPLYSTNGSSNYYGYSNPKFDATVAEGDQSPTAEAAIKKYQDAEKILAEDLPVSPLLFGQNVYGFSSKVKNVSIDARTRVDLLKIEVK